MISIRYAMGVLLGTVMSCNVLAQGAPDVWPSRQISLVVTVAPGTVADLVGRTIAPKLAERLKQPVVVENKVGASGVIGADAVAKSAPNGYTLMLMVNSLTMVPSLYKNIPYDTLGDFAPISRVATSGYSFVVNLSAMPVKDLNEFIALVKANPGKYSYSSPGKGTAHHLAMELIKQNVGLDLLHVPHKDMGSALGSVLGAHVPMMFAPTASVLPQAKAGSLRILAVTGSKRSPIAPNVPTYSELGYKFLEDVDGYWGVMAPAKTSPAIITRLNRELLGIMALQDVKEKLATQDVTAVSSTPEELGAQMKADVQRWAKLISDAKITTD
ncbi:MAG: tripartite tricarboxylate transporter substrate binding protein [Burkholderiales bacterium]